MGWAAGAGEGWVHAWGEGIGGVAIDVYGYGYGYGGWRGRKEKDLMVGQISFYVFCCCVVRMDGFVQNRINEFVQRHLAFFSRFYDSATPPSQHAPSGGTCPQAESIRLDSSFEYS